MNKYTAIYVVVFAIFSFPVYSNDFFISGNTPWKYLDDGTDPGASWVTLAYDDSLWSEGDAPLGYGYGSLIATEVSYGPDPANKYITTYFRKTFFASDPSLYVDLAFTVQRDDGFVAYLNGVEIARNNLPAQSTHNTTALTESSAAEVLSYTVDASLLNAGQNVLAIEVHQFAPDDDDLGIFAELSGNIFGNNFLRGPYLQMGTDSSMTIKWRTETATNSVVNYGLSPGALGSTVSQAALTTEHEVVVSGLSPDTRYYYDIGSTGEVLAGGDAVSYFETSPTVGEQHETRVWVIGDSGTANNNARNVYTAYQSNTGAAYTDLWLMLGDNAYNNGTDEEYQSAVFETYAALLRQTPVWPAVGNHEGVKSDTPLQQQDWPYYKIFSLPTAGESGGVPSGTESYYSFDYANQHYIVLDSFTTTAPFGAEGEAMISWLEADLQATTAQWIIAFWHHPPYSKGSHDSDIEQELIDIREHALPVLESYGVDLVLSGHSHSYERSKLIDGLYGAPEGISNSEFYSEAAHDVDGGDGKPNSDGAYTKQSAEASDNGTVYIVAGSSGKVTNGVPLNHPAMLTSLPVLGSLVLTIDGLVLDASFIDDEGIERDYFQLRKDVDTDLDTIADILDNCPLIANVDQLDTDSDTEGDVCDMDDDGDGYSDQIDAFPLDASEWLDTDGDGVGNNTDTDDDNDSVLDVTDNCPLFYNPEQRDHNLNGTGDDCEVYHLNSQYKGTDIRVPGK